MAPSGKGKNGKGMKPKKSAQTAENNTNNKNILRSKYVDDQMDQSQVTQLTQ